MQGRSSGRPDSRSEGPQGAAGGGAGAREVPDVEPRVAAGLAALEEGDFHALSDGCARDPQYNDRRLVLRRKLGGTMKVFAARAKDAGLELDVRTSLHNPHAFNRMTVRRQWAYACRTKQEKTRLRRVLGAELAKDLDAAYRNAYLCLALETDVVEVSLRIHAEAWYDGQNLLRRTQAEGRKALLEQLNQLAGFRLRLADWKGEWLLGDLAPERLGEFLKFWVPGEHALVVERRWPAPPGARAALLAAHVPEELVGELARLVPLYRWAAWSAESDFLFAS